MFYFPQRIAKLFWKNGGMEKNNIPFSIVETKQLDCHFGPHYYQECKPKSHRVFLQGTRKIGCNARIIIKKCKIFHDRPHSVILHCLERKSKSAKYAVDSVHDVDPDLGIFER